MLAITLALSSLSRAAVVRLPAVILRRSLEVGRLDFTSANAQRIV